MLTTQKTKIVISVIPSILAILLMGCGGYSGTPPTAPVMCPTPSADLSRFVPSVGKWTFGPNGCTGKSVAQITIEPETMDAYAEWTVSGYAPGTSVVLKVSIDASNGPKHPSEAHGNVFVSAYINPGKVLSTRGELMDPNGSGVAWAIAQMPQTGGNILFTVDAARTSSPKQPFMFTLYNLSITPAPPQ